MDVDSTLKKLHARVERERAGRDFGVEGFSKELRLMVVRFAADLGVKRVSDATGISNPSIYGWRSRFEEVELEKPENFSVTRISVQSPTESRSSEAVARFWIGDTAVEIFSAAVVLELARRSVGG